MAKPSRFNARGPIPPQGTPEASGPTVPAAAVPPQRSWKDKWADPLAVKVAKAAQVHALEAAIGRKIQRGPDGRPVVDPRIHVPL